LDQAIIEYRKAVELDENYALAHFNLASALYAANQSGEAIVEYQTTIGLDANYAPAHYGLGIALSDKDQLDAAVAALQKATELDPKYAEAYYHLGDVLRRLGRFAEAVPAFRRGHELGSLRPGWRHPSADVLRQAEREAAMEEKLPSYRKGEYKPRDNNERLSLAEVCRIKQLYRTSAALSADVFAADPPLADRLIGLRYNAACCAARAAAGQGRDAAQLDDHECAQLRQRALEWLRADLEQWRKLWDGGKPADRQLLHRLLPHWPEDSDLAGVRDPDALKKLPAAEQEAWRQLWADVAELLKKAELK
jgi:tetratricopeptide (TPR) repeat protein